MNKLNLARSRRKWEWQMLGWQEKLMTKRIIILQFTNKHRQVSTKSVWICLCFRWIHVWYLTVQQISVNKFSKGMHKSVLASCGPFNKRWQILVNVEFRCRALACRDFTCSLAYGFLTFLQEWWVLMRPATDFCRLFFFFWGGGGGRGLFHLRCCIHFVYGI